jgi:hypothetical protein
LAGHTGTDTDLGPTTRAAAERVDTAPGSGHTYRAGDIRADTYATSLCKESTFAAS